MKTRFASGLAVATLAVLLTGCTGGGDTTPPPADTGTTEEAPTTPETGDAELMTADSDLGEIVVDAEGMTVYMFDNDTQGGDTSTCEGECATNWPAVTTDADAPAVDGVTGEVGTITGVDGSTQVTLNGWPLYYFVGDTAAGDVNGQAMNNVWWVLNPAGEKISE
ncbi:COG4315 family predicted lipoprotein [Homoserinimonas sp. A447]